jgi:hypothetical protein
MPSSKGDGIVAESECSNSGRVIFTMTPRTGRDSIAFALGASVEADGECPDLELRAHPRTLQPSLIGAVGSARLRDIRGPTVCPASFRRTIQASALRDFQAGLIVTCYTLIAKLRDLGLKCSWLLRRASRQSQREKSNYRGSVAGLHGNTWSSDF